MNRETRVGLTVLAGLACFGLLVVFLGRMHFSRPGYPVVADFNFVDSLRVDAPVLYGGGVEVGMVDSMEVVDGKVRCVLHIFKGNQIPKNSVFTIHTSGILGEKYVQIAAGDLSLGALEPGARVRGVDPGSLDRTLQRVEALTQFLEPLLQDPDFRKNFGKIFTDIAAITGELGDLVNDASPDIRASVKNLKSVSVDLKKTIADANALIDNAKSMTDRKNRDNLKESLDTLVVSVKRLDQALVAIDNQEGALGVLIHDEETKENLRFILRDLKNHPWKLLWKK